MVVNPFDKVTMHPLCTLRPQPHPSPSHRPSRTLNAPAYLNAAVSRFLTQAVLARWYAAAPTGPRQCGAVNRFSDKTIAVLLEIRLPFGLSLSGVLGLVADHFAMRGVTLRLPNKSTLSRRAQRLGMQLFAHPLPPAWPRGGRRTHTALVEVAPRR